MQILKTQNLTIEKTKNPYEFKINHLPTGSFWYADYDKSEDQVGGSIPEIFWGTKLEDEQNTAIRVCLHLIQPGLK